MESESRSVWNAMWRGAKCCCPACGTGAIFGGFLKIADNCSVCGTALYHHKADDAPPYFTMFIVGHIVIPGVVVVEKLWRPAIWLHFALWFPLAVGLTFLLMPRVKGAIVGLQWALRMHGFAVDGEIADRSEFLQNQPGKLDFPP
jgi:uncharacterized protein (DUF983 family)